jgi:hypothetical protein
MASLGDGTHLANCRKRAVDALRLWLHPFNPAQDCGRRVTAILAFLVGKMMLVVKIEQPFLMGS